MVLSYDTYVNKLYFTIKPTNLWSRQPISTRTAAGVNMIFNISSLRRALCISSRGERYV